MAELRADAAHLVSKCPSCGAPYRLRISASGRKARCATCRASFIVPGKEASFDDVVLAWMDKGKPDPDADLDDEQDLQAPARGKSTNGPIKPPELPKAAAPPKPAVPVRKSVSLTKPKPAPAQPGSAAKAAAPKPEPAPVEAKEPAPAKAEPAPAERTST